MSNPTIAEQAGQFAAQMASQDVFSVFAREQVELTEAGGGAPSNASISNELVAAILSPTRAGGVSHVDRDRGRAD
jgi:hypothetical protein